MVIFDAVIAALAAFAVAWMVARQRASQQIPARLVLTLAVGATAVATVLLTTEVLPAGPVVGALAIMLGGMAGRLAARPRQHTR